MSGIAARACRRIFDILFSSLVLLASPIVVIPVAIAIRANSCGPVIFRQKRTGLGGRVFTCLKFRTMHVRACTDEFCESPSDAGITAVGRLLRRTSIDELPQFLNVLAGDMSVIGPRPHMLSHTAHYSALIPGYDQRLQVKPGITGWAQVNGYRGPTDALWKMQKRVEYDMWYIRNRTCLLDLKILLRSVKVMWSGFGKVSISHG